MNPQESRDLTEIRARIAFGLDVKAFMASSIGRYLTGRANAEIDAALDALRTVDPTQPDAIRKLQNDVKCAENFLLWLGEAETEGENAETAFVEAQG